MARLLITLSVLLAAVCVCPAYAGEPDVDDYLTRHVTFWYHGEDEFIRFEDSLRGSTRPLVGRYGPENRYLMERIEEVYADTARKLGLDPAGFRVNLELVRNSNDEGRLGPEEGAKALEEFGVYYDRRSNTVYMYSADLGPEQLGAALAVALVSYGRPYTPPRALIESAVRAVRGGRQGAVPPRQG